MLKLNKKIEYALISLKHISRKDEGSLCSAKEISQFYQLPFDVTSRVLQQLKNQGWLVSEQGAGGGYRLEKEGIENRSLYDLITAIEGEHAVVKCLTQGKDCPVFQNCNMVSPMAKLNESLNYFLKSQKVEAFLGSSPTFSTNSKQQEVAHVGG